MNEFDSLIDEAITKAKAMGGDNFVPGVIASKLIVSEGAAEPLDEWLHERAAIIVTAEVTTRLRQERNRAVKRFSERTFAQAAEEAANGDLTALSQFTVTYEVDKNHTRRQVAEMTGDDHKFVADKYQATGKYDLMLAAFHRQVAKVVGKKRTAEVMSEEQYAEILHSITNRMSG